MGMSVVFSDENYCIEELSRIRETWGNKTSFTFKSAEAIRYTLGFMYLYCPRKLQSIVEGHLLELDIRERCLLFPVNHD
jgi:hypothetical protein